jgi:hypothetical protein
LFIRLHQAIRRRNFQRTEIRAESKSATVFFLAAIDPFTTKNRQLSKAEMDGRLRITKFRPNLSNSDDTALINTLQILAAAILQKSPRESFGLSVTDAIWRGTPVIAGMEKTICL